MNNQALTRPSFSIVIPTYNRKDSLVRTLESLDRQTYPAERTEVIIVDDGGNDETACVVECRFGFELHYLRQENQGAAIARNNGAMKSRGDVLVFIDDDITLFPDYLSAIAKRVSPGTLAMGLWHPYEDSHTSPFSVVEARKVQRQVKETSQDQVVPYTECTSNNVVVSRSDFIDVGMWQDVLGDGPTLWGDVEFGFRAHQKGCRFIRVASAGIVHRDRHISDLSSATQRAYHVSQIVQPLFKLHPEIRGSLPMFRDKGPIEWREDSPSLILRKLARQVASLSLIMGAMKKLVSVLERWGPNSWILPLVYRWIISGYIYRGYRDGLRSISLESYNV